ncbi:PREDICTED: uncharacterized protein LOC107085251 [Cyprinodon variegatus]|uniref:uncharacterized protein LOC107085251 n=1 Tax=Cyprinodon variegatus TaxID=28743 RepID=UPI000742BCDB|nr:PREDICTED: uncharacterized protein LOC107085251 [Cyprinodon variegatus]
MSVEVQFPCAANRRCAHDVCCPISKLIDPWTTVTVYNELNRSENQSRTVWTQEVVSILEFSGLSPGQSYCAVANFSFPIYSIAASPKSAPGCVATRSSSGMLLMYCAGIGLFFLVLLLFLAVFLQKPRRDRPTPDNPPKALTAAQDLDSLAPPVFVPVDPCDINLELLDENSSNMGLTSSSKSKTSSPLIHFDASGGVVYCYSEVLKQKR